MAITIEEPPMCFHKSRLAKSGLTTLALLILSMAGHAQSPPAEAETQLSRSEREMLKKAFDEITHLQCAGEFEAALTKAQEHWKLYVNKYGESRSATVVPRWRVEIIQKCASAPPPTKTGLVSAYRDVE